MCIWGQRVIIPTVYRDSLLGQLHEGHPGVCQMKALSHSYLWWPGLDKEIAKHVAECVACSSVRNTPGVAPLKLWPWPVQAWERIHIDYAQKEGVYFLVIIDSHSKWLEMFPTTSMTTSRTLELLRQVFAAYGLPKEVVSDNGPQFTAQDFQVFMTKNGVKHTKVAPYHPASNGAAERSVQILKKALDKQKMDGRQKGLPLKHGVANFLLKYRNTPHSVTEVSPAQLFFQREICTTLSLVKLCQAEYMVEQQQRQKEQHDKRHRMPLHTLLHNQPVQVRSNRMGKEKWMRDVVVAQKGSRHYLVRVRNTIRYVHIDHIVAVGHSQLGNSIPEDEQPLMPGKSTPKDEQPMWPDPRLPLAAGARTLPPPLVMPPSGTPLQHEIEGEHHMMGTHHLRSECLTNHQTRRWPFHLQCVVTQHDIEWLQ